MLCCIFITTLDPGPIKILGIEVLAGVYPDLDFFPFRGVYKVSLERKFCLYLRRSR